MHIFYIHSHITYLIAQLYIKSEKLDKFGFITSRSYDVGINERVFNITSFYEYLEKCGRLKKLVSIKSKIRDIDESINQIVQKRKFTIYLPQFNHSIFQILASHPLCKATVLIEEGITSYKRDEKLYLPTNNTFVNKMLSIYSMRFLLSNRHYYPFPRDKFKIAICLDGSCFPYLPSSQKQILEINKLYFPSYNCTMDDYSTIFLLDSFKERTGINNSTYFSIINSTLQLINEKSKQLFIKFHPEQSIKTRKETISFIQKTFKFENVLVLDDDCIVELEFLMLKDLTAIGMHTSLLFYAHKLKHNVVSGIKVTSQIPEINAYIDHVMDKHQKEIYMSYE